jgi:gamma-glutamyl hydrolase
LDKVDHLNGIFYCGGATTKPDYESLGKAIFEKVKAKNDAGEYYPIWGTCLGFEDMLKFAGEIKTFGNYVSEKKTIPLKFIEDPE